MRLAIIDLDGVVANVEARFQKAAEAERAAMPERLEDALGLTKEQEKELTNLYWRTVFAPEHVSLDTVIDGAIDTIAAIEQHEEDIDLWQVLYLTSRPESMRTATQEWLLAHRLSGPKLVMKASAFQYVKTITWKAGIVQTLAALYQANEVLVVDDEPANLQEIERYRDTFGMLTTAKSLPEALAKLKGTWIEPDPFLPDE